MIHPAPTHTSIFFKNSDTCTLTHTHTHTHTHRNRNRNRNRKLYRNRQEQIYNNNNNEIMAKKVAIIGGGWIGLQVAMNLEKADPKGEAVEVTIFDAKKHFYNNVAGLRLCVEPEFIVKAVVPRDQALKRSKIIQAEVETIIPDGPALKLKARDEAIPADFIVLATGTRYPFPGKVPWWLGHMAAGRMYQKIRDRISRAKKIVIVGGGPTGVELAGELCEFFPEISTTLVHSGDRLMHTYHGVGKDQVLKTTTTDKIQARIEKMGCNVVLNERIVIDSGGKTGLAAGEGDGVDDSSMAAKETETFMQDRTEDLKAESGRTFPADLVFYCTGTTANSDVYTNVFKVGEGNRVACDEYLRCRLADDSGSAPAVYAAGDCCLSKFIDGQHTGKS